KSRGSAAKTGRASPTKAKNSNEHAKKRTGMPHLVVTKLTRQFYQIQAVSGKRFENEGKSGAFGLGQVHIQNRHVEVVRGFAVFFILVDGADEFAVDVDLDGIIG